MNGQLIASNNEIPLIYQFDLIEEKTLRVMNSESERLNEIESKHGSLKSKCDSNDT